MNTPLCKQSRCTLWDKCQRYSVAGSIEPIMPFLPDGLFHSPSIDQNPEAVVARSEFDAQNYIGAVNGCADYWPVGTGTEFFLENFKKTPIT